jgi:hypothetical protein
MPPELLTRRANYDNMGYKNHIQNGPHDCRGPAIAHGSKAKLASQVSATSANRARDKV